ncbi:hypothetical protein MXF19_26635, partial [Klebsiella pneumoniae]|nr:hypothetical protein [Klebsiella pneumoniae]
EQLTTLRKELRDIFQVELNTIKTDMRLQLQDLALEIEQTKNHTLWKITKGRVLYPALSALTVLLTICLAGSGYLHWQISQ